MSRRAFLGLLGGTAATGLALGEAWRGAGTDPLPRPPSPTTPLRWGSRRESPCMTAFRPVSCCGRACARPFERRRDAA